MTSRRTSALIAKGHEFIRAANAPELSLGFSPGFASIRTLLAALILSSALVLATGCKSPHVAVTVQNQTGAEVRLLEVDYPSASFGADHLAPGASIHYSIAVTGSGPMKLQYTMPNNAVAQASGPEVSEGESGTLSILLTPNGHAEFHPELHGGK